MQDVMMKSSISEFNDIFKKSEKELSDKIKKDSEFKPIYLLEYSSIIAFIAAIFYGCLIGD